MREILGLVVTLSRLQKFQPFFRFNSFGDRAISESPWHREYGFDNSAVVGIDADAADELTVYLQYIVLQHLQVGER
ncbi:MAG: hypothetical protein ABW161_19470 [Candidatus Thiodiazotropha sp.]